jgi:hypothetical protein
MKLAREGYVVVNDEGRPDTRTLGDTAKDACSLYVENQIPFDSYIFMQEKDVLKEWEGFRRNHDLHVARAILLVEEEPVKYPVKGKDE